MKFSTLIVFLLTGLSIAGCAKHTEVIKLYDNSRAIDGQFERLLVVSIASDIGTRRRLEDLITADLSKSGLIGTPSYSETGLTTNILQSDLDAAAEKSVSDAMLITHIASIDTDVDVTEGRVDILSECRGGDPVDYFLYDRVELQEPDSVKIAHTVVVITSLYEVSSGERVWTIQSTCFEKASMDEVLREESAAIVRQLRFDNLVR